MNGPGRHVPLRRCVACGRRASKAELVRIVATPGSEVRVDAGGKLQGRGTYVCRVGACAKGSLKRSRLEYALRRKIEDQQWTEVVAAVEALPD